MTNKPSESEFLMLLTTPIVKSGDLQYIYQSKTTTVLHYITNEISKYRKPFGM
jgi:hypothetical protein